MGGGNTAQEEYFLETSSDMGGDYVLGVGGDNMTDMGDEDVPGAEDDDMSNMGSDFTG